MKRFGDGNAQYINKESTPIRNDEETEVHHVSKILLVMEDYYTTPTEDENY